MSAKVLGLDLSLTCTGVAGNGWTAPLRPPAKLRGTDRLLWIRGEITERWVSGVDLVAIEGPSYGNQGQGRQAGHHERAGLWWIIRCALATRDIPVAVVPPATLKRYATGRGTADKASMVLAAARHFSWYEGTEDEADALMLAAMAADHLGEPIAAMPAANRAALDKVEWPELLTTLRAVA
jgi:Holliday junction resolvasome RuvABC endonuclease subunit